MHLSAPPPVPSRWAVGIPSAIDRLVLRCMAKDPDRRFTACELASTIGALSQTPWFAALSRQASAPSSGAVPMGAQPTLPAAPDRSDHRGLRLLRP
jgi:serine/threonine protein kinase